MRFLGAPGFRSGYQGGIRMKAWKKRFAALFFAGAACVSLAAPVSAAEEGWRKDGDSWQYQEAGGLVSDGWKLVNNHWYHFDAEGNMQTGWQLADGRWRYFAPEGSGALPEGAMVTGFLELPDGTYYLDEWGGMRTEDLALGGRVLLFDENGRLCGSRPEDMGGLSFDFPKGWSADGAEGLLVMLPEQEQPDGTNILMMRVDTQPAGALTPAEEAAALEESMGALLPEILGLAGLEGVEVSAAPLEGTRAPAALEVTASYSFQNGGEDTALRCAVFVLLFEDGFAEVCYTAPADSFSSFYDDALSAARSLTLDR